MPGSRERADGGTGERATVLVVDDDPEIRQTIQWTLEDEGFAVETAADGREALRRAELRRPALVILDWGLPGLSGEGFASLLRTAHGDSVPIVLITADGRAAEKARRVRAQDYLHKPFELDDLVSMVRRGLDAG